MYKPNLKLPLVPSYNTRGASVPDPTAPSDQRKVNQYYEVVKNSALGSGGEIYLSKRPAVAAAVGTWGISTQAAYQIITPPLGSMQAQTNSPWVFSTLGNDIRVSDSASTKVIFSSGSAFAPIFIDKTLISGAETIVVQARQHDFITSHRAFYNSSSIGAAWTEITDGDFTSLIHMGKMEHMDGFMFTLESNNKIFNSDLNSLANWTATSFLTKQIKQDAPVSLAKLGNQILAFGDETVEVFYNAGNATGSPLLGIKQLQANIGMIPTSKNDGVNYYTTIGNKLYFVGRRAGGLRSQGVFSYNGSSFEKISSQFIDKILAGETNPTAITSFGFYGNSAVAISLTGIPSAGTHYWLVYIPDHNEWFEWNSSIFQPINSSEYFLGISPKQDTVYQFPSSDKFGTDDSSSYSSFTQFKLPQDGHQLKKMAEFGVLADTQSLTDPLLVEFSDNDGQTFYTVGSIELARDIKTLNRGGSYRKRMVRLTSTSTRATRLSSFIARIE